MTSLTKTLEQIKQLVAAIPEEKWNWHFHDQSWNPGLSREDIDRITAKLPHPLPSELYELYQWHNGNYAISLFYPELTGLYEFYSLEDGVDLYLNGDGDAWGGFLDQLKSLALLPIGGCQNEDFYALHLQQGSLWTIDPCCEAVYLEWDNLLYFAQAILEAWELGLFQQLKINSYMTAEKRRLGDPKAEIQEKKEEEIINQQLAIIGKKYGYRGGEWRC